MSGKRWYQRPPWPTVLAGLATVIAAILASAVTSYASFQDAADRMYILASVQYGETEAELKHLRELIDINGELICGQNTEDQIHDDLFRDILASLGRLEGAMGTYTATPGEMHENLRKVFYRDASLTDAAERPFGG